MQQSQRAEFPTPPWSNYQAHPEPERVCRVCGCSDNDACLHPKVMVNCWWVGPDLCSFCQLTPGEATRYSILEAEAAAGGAFCD